jgi:hypothetical protein
MVEEFALQTLHGWLITCGVCLLILTWLYRKVTKGPYS